MIQAILATALLVAPPTEPAPSLQPQDIESMFPTATGPLTIKIDSETPAMSYLELLRTYGELTNQYFTYDQETNGYLEAYTVRLDRSVTIPAEQVPLFVESLLVRNDLVLSPLPSAGIRIVEVSSLQTQARSTLRSTAIRLPSGRLDVARAHPASLFMTTLELKHADVRQVSNSMRTMITDANTQQMLPAGTMNSIVLVGFGTQVADLAQMLLEVDAAAKPKAPTGREFEVVRLEKAKASELAVVLSSLTQSAMTAGVQAQGGPVVPSSGPKVLADERTNSLLLSGKADQLAMLKELIVQLDV